MQYKRAPVIARVINHAKNNTNLKFKGIYYSSYFRNETNPYLRSQRFGVLLKDSLMNHKDLYKAIIHDYRKYLLNNTSLRLRNGRSRSYNGRKREPEIEHLPKWATEKPPKLHKASSLLNKLNQAHIKYLKAMDNPKVSQDKKNSLKKRVDHYQKVFDNKQTSSKLKIKRKLTERSKELHKTSPALQRQIKARLQRLGEF